GRHVGKTGDIAARSCQTRNNSTSDWIGRSSEYDGNCRARLLSSPNSRVRGGDDQINFETDQFGGKVRQPVEFPFCISVLKENIFSFDIPKLAQPLAK